MNRNIEQVLLSLLPTQNSDLPPQLVELAGSLLAQSRHRASTLKAEEEIARPYACAHIACDRLKMTLNLPPIEPRPPIPPRIYKRLYSHLDHILPRAAPGSRARARRPQDGGLGGSSPAASPAAAARPLPSRGTPGKDASLAQFRRGGGSRAAPRRADGSALPPWVRPAARFLCRELGTEPLGPTVMAGMEAIAAPHGRRTDDAWVGGHLAGLLAAVYWFVAERAAMQETGRAVDAARYKAGRARILDALARAAREVEVEGVPGGGGDAWEGWEMIGTKELDRAVTEVNRRDWLKSDWYRGVLDIKDGEGHGQGEEGGGELADEEEEGEGGEGGEDRHGRCWWKQDTMFQDRYDYLSEENIARYNAWREGVMERIRRVEEKALAMEVDPLS